MAATGVTTTAVKSLKRIYEQHLDSRKEARKSELESEREKEVQAESLNLIKEVNELIKDKFPWLAKPSACSCTVGWRGESLKLKFRVTGSVNGKVEKINEELSKLWNNHKKQTKSLEDWEIAALKAVALSEKKLPDFKYDKEG